MNDITVVGWDDTEQSQVALQWAARRALLHSQQLLIATATDRFAVGYALTPEEEAAARVKLEAAAHRIQSTYSDLSVAIRELDGTPVDALVELSKNADLVVVGAPRSQGPHRKAAWSVGGGLAVRSHAPVAVIPDTTNTAVLAEIAVAVDGSELAIAAAEFAADEAMHAGVGLNLVFAWQEPDLWMRSDLWTEDITRRMQEEHRATLQELASRIRTRFPTVNGETTLSHGSVARVLASLEPEPGLIVVGSRARARVSEVLLSTVAFELLVNAKSPVLIVPIDAEARLHARYEAGHTLTSARAGDLPVHTS